MLRFEKDPAPEDITCARWAQDQHWSRHGALWLSVYLVEAGISQKLSGELLRGFQVAFYRAIKADGALLHDILDMIVCASADSAV